MESRDPKPQGQDDVATADASEGAEASTEQPGGPKPMGKDYATTEEVSAVAGVERAALYDWLREGLLPRPRTTGGRGIIAKWPLVTLTIAAFVREQRDLAYGLREIRPRIVKAFGEKILEVLAEPKGRRARGRGEKTLPDRGCKKEPGACSSRGPSELASGSSGRRQMSSRSCGKQT